MIKVCNTYGLNDLPLGTKGRVIALGMFDGLHQGHMDIIRKAVATAERDGHQQSRHLKICLRRTINLFILRKNA